MRELWVGMSLGLGAGATPGPLLAVLLGATLRGGFRAGARVAVVPLLTDLPIVVLALTVLAALPGRATAVVALAGAAFVLWLAIGTYREAAGAVLEAAPSADPGIVRRAALINLLNPHAWLFWVTVGAPLLITAWAVGPAHAIAFVAGFYGMFVVSKLAIAVVVSRARGHLDQGWYRGLLRVTALLLAAAAVALTWEFVPRLV